MPLRPLLMKKEKGKRKRRKKRKMKKEKKKAEKKEKKKEEKKGKTSASPICTLKCIYKRLSYKWTEGQTNQWIDSHSSIDPTSGIKRTSASLISAPRLCVWRI